MKSKRKRLISLLLALLLTVQLLPTISLAYVDDSLFGVGTTG